MPRARGSVEPGGSPHYESWFLSARSPDARRGLWLRRTVHVGSHRQAHVAAWCTTFDTTTTTAKQIWSGGPDVTLLATPDRFHGAASAAGHEARWDLTVDARAAAVRPMSP